MNIKIDLNLNAPEQVEALRSLKEEILAIKLKNNPAVLEGKGNGSSTFKGTNTTLETVRTKLAALAQSGNRNR